jgi:hypothetical protein
MAAAVAQADSADPVTASATAVTDCAVHQKRALDHEKKARAYDRKATKLRKKAKRSKSARRKMNRYRALTRKHIRALERHDRRYNRCKLRLVAGSYTGTVEGGELPVSFTVSSDGKSVTGFQVEVVMHCRAENGVTPPSFTSRLSLPEKLDISDAGKFEARTFSRANPFYVVTGHLHDGKANGTVSYASGSARDLNGRYCRSGPLTWSATRS